MIGLMNELALKGIPFLFIIDFEAQSPIVIPIKEAKAAGILFDVDGYTNAPALSVRSKPVLIKKHPISYERYKMAFDRVQKHLNLGNSYLVNLTFPTQIDINLSFKELYLQCYAKYKLLFKDQFLVFSPESFIKIRNGKIYSFPMKGTIDADIPNAKNLILNDHKERAEHCTIVDLIRNDLGMVSNQVKVESFRYIDRIRTIGKDLLQVSSKISGELPIDYPAKIGDIIFSLLPAGSISGAPKKKTVEIIKEAEMDSRGYYSGIFGYYAHGQLDSAVMIRYMEQNGEETFFRSGGGVTVYSDPKAEYQELIDKVYVPLNRNDKNRSWKNLPAELAPSALESI